jgi:hypothetical protein
MTGVETITILVCLVFGVVLIAVAWWVSGIQTALARLAVDLEVRHLERSAERAAEKRMRDVRQKHFFQWLAETASTLNKLHGLGEKLGEPQDTMVMSSTPALTARPKAVAPPATVREPRSSDAVLPGTEVSGDQPRESDADTLCWTGPGSSRTLLGVGVQQLTAPAHGSPRAQQLAQELRKTGP